MTLEDYRNYIAGELEAIFKDLENDLIKLKAENDDRFNALLMEHPLVQASLKLAEECTRWGVPTHINVMAQNVIKLAKNPSR